MLGGMVKYLSCRVCEEGELKFDASKTMDAYSAIFELEDALSIVDGVIAQYLVFECLSCGAVQRLTFKDIEKEMRQKISHKVMTLKASGLIDKAMRLNPRYYIFCGNCTGFDGKGSCPKSIYENCSIRRIPNGL